MFDGRSRHAQEVLADVGGRYDVRVLEPPVRKSIRFAEATQAGRSILRFSPSHPGADAYRALAGVLEGEKPPLKDLAGAEAVGAREEG
jgi:chromosome partitioning protein